ncbi:MAG: S8 family serine peptidase, partial [Frankia sp.]|nr:S8 family serine peptidase [Frankia sp.]
MTISIRRRVVFGLLSTLVAGAATALPAGAERPVAAVVSFTHAGTAPALGRYGVRVRASYAHVGAAVVSGTPGALARLARDAQVHAVSPDRSLRPTSATADTGPGLFAAKVLGGQAGKPDAGTGVTVAVVDTGISDTAALSRESGRLLDGVNTASGTDFSDGYGHGTFLATLVAGGTVPASGSRALGIAPAATVVNVKVAGTDGTTTLARVVAGLDWVAAHAGDIDVASFAFSGDRPGSGYGPDPLTDAAERVRDAGVVMVVSAGNVPGQVGDPGFDPRVLTVGAADL